MLLIHLIQDMSSWMAYIHPDTSLWHTLSSHLHVDWSLLAQEFNTDVFAGTRKAFNNFVQSGQIWALIIGFVLGYILRGLTSYG